MGFDQDSRNVDLRDRDRFHAQREQPFELCQPLLRDHSLLNGDEEEVAGPMDRQDPVLEGERLGDDLQKERIEEDAVHVNGFPGGASGERDHEIFGDGRGGADLRQVAGDLAGVTVASTHDDPFYAAAGGLSRGIQGEPAIP